MQLTAFFIMPQACQLPSKYMVATHTVCMYMAVSVGAAATYSDAAEIVNAHTQASYWIACPSHPAHLLLTAPATH
jgi:hypothetical protein